MFLVHGHDRVEVGQNVGAVLDLYGASPPYILSVIARWTNG